jgi:uncharacterized protein
MDKQEIIQKTAEMVKEKFQNEGSGHDWWHIYRVWQLAKSIAKKESADSFVVELGALLHDIADYKFHDGDEEIGGKVTKEWLENLGVDSINIENVVHIVNNVSFKGGNTENKMKSIEGFIVQDADRLDAIGAMGIARCFAYGGYKGNEIYNPEIKPNLKMTKEEYKTQKGTQINHFYEKLLLLKDRMNTETGRKFAQERHEYMENFLEEFFAEWEGEK